MTVRALALLLVALTAGVRQPPKPVKRVALRIQPRVGDTLRMRFDQVVQAAGPAPANSAPPTRTSSMRVLSRSVVERVDAAGAVVLTITDSAAFDAPGVDPRQVDAARKAMRGRWARMRVSSAGAMELLGGPPPAGSDGAALTRLPGTLPDAPVAVGATWTREMALPWTGAAFAAGAEGGRLQVVFRLDSVAGNGTLAFVSMHGALARAGVAQRGARVTTSGTMSGFLRVDLRRGWMTDSRATFAMVSTMTPGPGTSKGRPMELRVSITQRLHCAE